VHYTYCDSPLGELLVAGDELGLGAILLPCEGQRRDPPPDFRRGVGTLGEAVRQLGEYFAGERTTFDLRLAQRGTPFQLKVWSELRRIPYGVTISYGELARRVGRPQGFRAVGAANGRNQLPIVVPCHRVIAADGTLGGYGGGLPAKRRLLELERQVLSGAPTP
jgi:methylated-DNA-[protein]-cysteine S-methyltransferase